jgi:L-arabinose isomerase
LNLRTKDCIGPIADFESIVLRWVVGGGNHDTTLSIEMAKGEIKHWSGTSTQISYMEAGVEQAFKLSFPELF